MRVMVFAWLALMWASGSAWAQTGSPVLASDTVGVVGGYDAGAPTDTSRRVSVAVAGVPFTEALRYTRGRASGNPWDAAVIWNTAAPVRKGDLLLATFWLRNTGAAGSTLAVQVTFQINRAPWTTSLVSNAPVDRGFWTRYAIPFRATADEATGSASLQLRYGAAAQSFEVGGVAMENFGPVAVIPAGVSQRFAFYYATRSDYGAAWKVAARQTIERVRKGAMTIRVTDAAGRPVPGAQVQVTQTATNFLWSTAIDARSVICGGGGPSCYDLSPADQARYRAEIARNFNAASFDNGLKWPEWESERQIALDGLAWIEGKGLRVARGHTLLWPSFEPSFKLPPDIRPGTPATTVASRIDGHIADEVGTLRGRVPAWDVVNEPFDNYDIAGRLATPVNVAEPGVLGIDAIAHWFTLARQADPAARLFLNDYAIFESYTPARVTYDLALMRDIVGRGATVDGLGLQAHFGQGAPSFADMARTLRDFDPYVSRFSITEFDFETLDPALQADLTRDMMLFAFGTAKMDTFQMWGFWDGRHWLDSAPLFARDWTLKASGRMWQYLTQQVWRTRATLTADASGAASLRALFGRYVFRVVAGGRSCTVTRGFDADGVVVLPAAC